MMKMASMLMEGRLMGVYDLVVLHLHEGELIRGDVGWHRREITWR